MTSNSLEASSRRGELDRQRDARIQQRRQEALTIGDRRATARLLEQVRNQVPPADGTDFPTPDQVAVVLSALADYTAIQHMLGDTVRILGAGGAWPSTEDRAHIIGRYFHALADEIRANAWEARRDR